FYEFAGDPGEKAEDKAGEDADDRAGDYHQPARVRRKSFGDSRLLQRCKIFGMMRDVVVKKPGMDSRDPDAIHDAHEKAVEKIAARRVPGDQEGADDKNRQPKEGLERRRDDVNGSNPHREAE